MEEEQAAGKVIYNLVVLNTVYTDPGLVCLDLCKDIQMYTTETVFYMKTVSRGGRGDHYTCFHSLPCPHFWLMLSIYYCWQFAGSFDSVFHAISEQRKNCWRIWP